MNLTKIFLSLMVGISFNSLGMERKSTVFESGEQMCKYGQLMANAAEKQNWHLIWYMADPCPVIGYSPITHSDYEFFLFSRTEALYKAYKNLIEEKKCDANLCINYYEKIINEFSDYIQNFGNFTSQIQTFNNRMTFHRFFIFHHYGDAYYQMATLTNDGKIEDKEKFLKEAKDSFNLAIQYCNKTLYLFEDNLEICSTLKEKLPEVRFSLISALGSLVQFVPENEEASLIAQIRDLRKEFNKEGKKYIEGASQTIEIIHKLAESKRLLSKPKGSPAIEEIRGKNYSEIQQEILYLVSNLETKQKFGNHIISSINLKQKNLDIFISFQEADWAEKVTAGLIEIEDDIRKCLTKEASSTITTTTKVPLEEIYQNLSTLLGTDSLINNYWKYIAAFVVTGNLDSGIERAEILRNIEKSEIGDSIGKNQFIVAALKNLQGDHEEWLALEEAIEKESQRQQQEKEQEKETARQRKVKTIKDFQAFQKQQEEEHEKRKEATSKKPGTAQTCSEATTGPYASFPWEPTIPDAQRKLEKRLRHEEAEQNRVKPKDEGQEKEASPKEGYSPATTPACPLSKQEQRDHILQLSDKSLAELYGLTSRALDVDNEIEHNTWQFTRRDFEIYLTTMGCISKEGKGVHTKASLPKATHIVHGDTLITVLNDFGGALTLPLWDKDYVPHYLKTQILEARKNLRALKILEIQAENPQQYP